MSDWYRYPAVFTYAEDGISVEFPDLPGCLTCGEDEAQAIKMAKEAMALHLFGMEEDGDPIPDPTVLTKIKTQPNEVIALIEVFMPPYRRNIQERFVKKNLTIPKWLDDLAQEHNVNFSQVLQGALKDYLGVNDSHQ